MKTVLTVILTAILFAPTAALAQGVDIEAAMKAAQQFQRQQGTQPSIEVEDLPDVIALKESDVTRFIDTVAQLKASGIDFDQKQTKQSPEAAMKALAANSKAQGIIKKSGFTPERLMQVAYSVVMAFASLDMDKDAVAKAQAQSAGALESMRSKLSPEQFAMIEAQMGASLKMVDQMQEQPEGNVALVTKHRPALEAALK